MSSLVASTLPDMPIRCPTLCYNPEGFCGEPLLERFARFVAADRLSLRRLRSWSSLWQERVSTIRGPIDGHPMNCFPASASLMSNLDGQHLRARVALSGPNS